MAADGMTAFVVPPHVAATIAARHAARVGRTCLYGCHAHARPYTGGTFCADHAPQPANPTPDPARTADALREGAAA